MISLSTESVIIYKRCSRAIVTQAHAVILPLAAYFLRKRMCKDHTDNSYYTDFFFFLQNISLISF